MNILCENLSVSENARKRGKGDNFNQKFVLNENFVDTDYKRVKD